VPGTLNYKYAAQPRVALIWDGGRTYRVSELERRLPRVNERRVDSGGEEIDQPSVSKLDGYRLSIKYRVALPLKHYVIKKANGEIDRSETIMAHAGFARKAGASDEEIAAMLRDVSPSFQDKYGSVLNARAWAEIERVCAKLEKAR
jgi:hypothetical protein